MVRRRFVWPSVAHARRKAAQIRETARKRGKRTLEPVRSTGALGGREALRKSGLTSCTYMTELDDCECRHVGAAIYRHVFDVEGALCGDVRNEANHDQ
jgi:hypothetical protein